MGNENRCDGDIRIASSTFQYYHTFSGRCLFCLQAKRLFYFRKCFPLYEWSFITSCIFLKFEYFVVATRIVLFDLIKRHAQFQMRTMRSRILNWILANKITDKIFYLFDIAQREEKFLILVKCLVVFDSW